MLACKHPYVRNPLGHRVSITRWLDASKKFREGLMPFPCGNCTPCRVNRQKEWSIRIVLESLSHDHNTFATLTYRDKSLTLDDHGTPQVDPYDLTCFLKRLRHLYSYRYFAVGEYGDETLRPHWHFMFFGIENNLENENLIENTWTHGFAHLDDLNFSTARYVTGYCMKKLTRKGDERLHGKKPEIMRSSRGSKFDSMGGLGRDTVRKIAKSIKRTGSHPERVIRKIRLGNNYYPLGRYLTNKLSDDLEIPIDVRDKDLLNYQLKLFKYGEDQSGSFTITNAIKRSKGASDKFEQWNEINRRIKRKL